MTDDEPYKPQAGHQVTATITGTVTEHGIFADFANVDGWTVARFDVTWTRLPDPEPDWQPGDVVRDADGDLYERTSDPRLVWRGVGCHWDDDDLKRPLVRLVPEVRP